jgi:polyhydroxyalkanoate synthesis repressor PhaR
VTLKKYGNRRLYDTSTSRYVTLVEVEQMVQRGADIVVLDAKSGNDITKEILVQLLLERDEARAALPVGLLKQAVKLAGTPLKDNLARVMQEGLDAFLGSQRAVVDAQRAFSAQVAQMAQMAQMPPLSAPPWTSGGVPGLWNPFAALTPPPARPGDVATAATATSQVQQPPSTATAAPSSPSQQLDALKAELSETQALVRRLIERDLTVREAAPRTRQEASPTTKTKRSKTTPGPGATKGTKNSTKKAGTTPRTTRR